MPVAFIIARDWTLRAMVRAELRERGVEALGMESGAEAGLLVANGTVPWVVVLQASEERQPGLESLARRVPFVVVASAVRPELWPRAARLLRRPARVGEIVAAVFDVLRGRAA